MSHTHKLALALVGLFAITSSACVVEPADIEGEEEDIGVDTSEITLQPAVRYYIVPNGGSDVLWIPGDTVHDWDMHYCDQFADGVVRSWQLKERNAKDFRYSRHFCRNMASDGTLESTSDFAYHFYYEGTGTIGTTSVPLDSLPVGVRIQAEYQPFSSPTYKISDVAMLYDQAADIADHFTGYSQASYALGRNDNTYTVVCPAGKVMTGLGISENVFSGGSDQSEISGLRIRCDVLVEEPIIVFP